MWFCEIFKKKEYNWVNVMFSVTYDLTKIPDLSPNSPINKMCMPYRFKYCAINNELMKFTIPDRGFIKVDLKESIKKFPELKKEIDKLTVDKRRDNILKNKDNL